MSTAVIKERVSLLLADRRPDEHLHWLSYARLHDGWARYTIGDAIMHKSHRTLAVVYRRAARLAATS